MKLPRVEILAKKIALDVLKAYHREMKSAVGTAVEREAGQAAAFAAAKSRLANIPVPMGWLFETVEDD